MSAGLLKYFKSQFPVCLNLFVEFQSFSIVKTCWEDMSLLQATVATKPKFQFNKNWLICLQVLFNSSHH